MTEAEAANRLMRLAKDIARHDRAYHDRDEPEISDADYDALMRENRALEAQFPALARADSPSKRLGAAPTSSLAKVAHAKPMLSLDNAFADEEVRQRLYDRATQVFGSLTGTSLNGSPSGYLDRLNEPEVADGFRELLSEILEIGGLKSG